MQDSSSNKDQNSISIFEQAIQGIITWEQVEQIDERLKIKGYELVVSSACDSIKKSRLLSSKENEAENLSLLITQAIAIIKEVFEKDDVSDRKVKTALEILRISGIWMPTSANSATITPDS